MKIVVVDDEALLVRAFALICKTKGYEVLTGSNGLEAVELAQDPEVGLMILDVMMPKWTASRPAPKSGVLSGPHHHADGKDGGYG